MPLSQFLYIRLFIVRVFFLFWTWNFMITIIFLCVDIPKETEHVVLNILFIFCGSAFRRGLWHPRFRGFVITYNDAPQSVGLLWTSDQLVAETSTWQHTQQTNTHASAGMRTHDRSRRAAVDLRFRPRGHWDRLFLNIINNYIFKGCDWWYNSLLFNDWMLVQCHNVSSLNLVLLSQ
jgi:hypothetical protein